VGAVSAQKVADAFYEKFRDKVKKTIEENLSTIGRELGEERADQWDENTLNRMQRKSRVTFSDERIDALTGSWSRENGEFTSVFWSSKELPAGIYTPPA
jgi:hypothetical protein